MNVAVRNLHSSEVYRCAAMVPVDFPVSDRSCWGDRSWHFEAVTAGARHTTFAWHNVRIGDERLLDPNHAGLLEQARRVMWSIRMASQRGRNPKDRTLAGMFVAMKSLLCWMMENGIRRFCELSVQKCKMYLGYVADRELERGFLSDYAMSMYADILLRIHEQSPLLAEFPDAVLAAHPFNNRTTTDVALDYSPKVRQGFIPSVPDEIYIATQAAAQDWVEHRADDVIRAVEYMLKVRTTVERGRSNSYGWRLNKALATFEFTRDASGNPWHAPMSDANAIADLRGLHNDVRDACGVSLQGLLGLRISELCGIEAGDFPEGAEWPTCITLDRSITGLNELFHLHGRVYKQREKYEEVTWLAGSRPAGSDYIPPAVKALVALWRLMRPWREMSGRTTLIVGFTGGGFPWTGGSVSRAVSEALGKAQKSWVEANVNLPEQYSGWQLRTHQWRKSFAMYMVRSDARLLPAVRDHFKHMSVAMTERGYLGRDVEMLGLLQDQGVYAAAQSLFEVMNGRPAAGRALDTIERNRATILELLGEVGTDEDRIHRLADILREDDIRVWPSEWGACLFRAEVARCHYEAKGSFNLNARHPHYGQRRPGVCCDCANLLIFSDDIEFWQARYTSGLAVWEANRAAGEYHAAAVAEDRLRTSAAILKRMGVDMPAIHSFAEEADDELV